MSEEHPLHTSFKGRVTLNGYKLQSDHSCGLPWIPESCLADGLRRETEAIQIMEHYGLDVSLAWYMQQVKLPLGRSKRSGYSVSHCSYGAAEGEYRRTTFSDSYSGRKHFPDSSYDWKDIYVDRP